MLRLSLRRGVTLTEVLVTTVIVMLLLAILFPVFSAVKGNAQETACASAARQNAMALLMYTQDYDTLYPIHDQTRVFENPGRGRGGAVVDHWFTSAMPNWSAAIYGYTRSKQISV